MAHASLELYGTMHAMGIIVTIGSGDDPDQDASAAVQYRTGGAPYMSGLPLSRVTDTRFVGSLFWLQPDTSYDVRVVLGDPDGGLLDNVTLDATASTRADIVIPAPNQIFYVSPAGAGPHCILAAPCSLSQGIGSARPGDEVVLRAGDYYQGDISLPRSGSDGAPIVIRGYPGETAVLNGTDPATFAWTPQGGGVYRATINVADPHLVVADGERLYPYQSLSDLQSLIWSLPGFYVSGTDLHVRLEGGVNPGSASMNVSRYNQAFYVERDFIFFLNLTFRHYGQGSYAKAIYFDGASDNLVRECTFHINDVGVGLKYDSHRNVFERNEFRDTVFDWPWDSVKAGSELETGGIVFYSPTTGRGNIIRHNTFHDYFDGFNASPDDTGGVTNETDVYRNLVYNIGDDGMETDGECSNVRIWGNTFHDVLMGISLAPVYTGPVYAIRNLVYRTGMGNNYYSGSPFKFNSGYGTSGPIYLLHNTSDAVLPDNNGLYIKAPGTWEVIYARNNIWAGTDYALDNYNTSQPVDLDYDALWTDGGGDLVSWDSGRYATLAAFTAATGQEAHGLNVQPGFADASNGNYNLASNSKLIDAGVLLPGINNDYSGAAPDIGAIEQTSTTTGVFRPSNGLIYLKSTNATGYADRLLVFGIPGDLPVTGDWDGDGVDTIGVYRNGVFYLRNFNTTGYADLTFAFGQSGDLPVAGDWDGDGVDTVGLYRNGQFMLRNSNSTGAPDMTFALGITGDEPIGGDWDGDGDDSTGVFRPSNGLIYLKNENTTGYADIDIVFGLPGDKPAAGDWDGDSIDTIGVYRNGLFLLRNTNTTGYADAQFALGVSGDLPICGRWGPLL